MRGMTRYVEACVFDASERKAAGGSVLASQAEGNRDGAFEVVRQSCNGHKERESAMKHGGSMPVLLALIAATQLTACSKTVQWEEEVPLNTGDVIWVKRTVKYTYQGGAGNPLDMRYRPESGSYVTEFSWRGKPYRFDLDAGVVLIAISPQGYPVLVGEAAAGSWDAVNNYKCTIPFYVQFVPDATGRKWTWPPKIEPWLYNLESNRLFAIPTPDDGKRRYTAEERKAANASGLVGSRSRQRINPAYTGDLCKSREK